MTPQVSAFRWVPDFAQGFVRDLRVRWALEEAGIPYEAELIGLDDRASPDYRDWQPFGQVPAFRDGEVKMFESGAIVLHLAGKSEALSPQDEAGLARTTTWVLAALNSVEPAVAQLPEIDLFHPGEAWTVERRPQVVEAIREKLAALAKWLGDKPYLEGDRFTAGDLIMTTVLRDVVASGLLTEFPTLDAYRERCMARPAFQRAMDAQLKPFAQYAPAA